MVNVPVAQAAFRNLAGIVMNRQLNPNSLEDMKDFRAHFGVAPAACVALWIRIQRALPRGATPFHLLWALLHLKTCGTQSALKGMVRVKTRKTFRDWVRILMKEIAGLAPSVASALH